MTLCFDYGVKVEIHSIEKFRANIFLIHKFSVLNCIHKQIHKQGMLIHTLIHIKCILNEKTELSTVCLQLVGQAADFKFETKF